MTGEIILAIDDNPDNLGVLKGILEREGYQIRPATSGKMALASLRHEALDPRSVDLIMLDILMPGMNGYEVCEQLKGQPATAGIPIIFISALSDPLDKVRAFEAGGVDYVTKPFNEQEVLARVRTHLQLHQLRQRLEHQNEELERIVAERTAALVASNAGLQRALQTRQDFLSLVSHELRTPLNIILGMVSILEGNPPPSSIPEHIQLIKSTGWHLLRLIDDILQLTRHGSTDTDAEEPIDLADLCNTSLDAFQGEIESRRLSASLEVEGEMPHDLTIPRARLLQIIGNLLDNAIRFTPEGGRIGIRLSRQADRGELLIDVWDSGPAISIEDRTRIFEPFTQLEAVMTRSHGGLGIGLTLAQQLVRLHGGLIHVSTLAGGGNLFRVELPMPPVE